VVPYRVDARPPVRVGAYVELVRDGRRWAGLPGPGVLVDRDGAAGGDRHGRGAAGDGDGRARAPAGPRAGPADDDVAVDAVRESGGVGRGGRGGRGVEPDPAA